MKSLLFIFMLGLGMSVMSCGHNEANTTDVDSTAVDSIDSASDSITE